jgi:hypothetical protein
LQTQISLLLGDWWSWFWGQTGVNGPPLAQSDNYSVGSNTTLSIGANSGVLANDFEPEGDPMVAAVTNSPRVGTLSFTPDGSFQYTPPAGFNGTVQFSYQASDFHQLSNVSTVVVSVGLIGDYDHNGAVTQLDYNVWRSSFGSTSVLDADGNGNGVVNAGDYVMWRMNLGIGAGAGAGSGSTIGSAFSASASIASATTTNDPSTAAADVQSGIAQPSAKQSAALTVEMPIVDLFVMKQPTTVANSTALVPTSQLGLSLLNLSSPSPAISSGTFQLAYDAMATDIVFSELGQPNATVAVSPVISNVLTETLNGLIGSQLL